MMIVDTSGTPVTIVNSPLSCSSKGCELAANTYVATVTKNSGTKDSIQAKDRDLLTPCE